MEKITKATLKRLYEVKKYSLYFIGRMLEVSPGTVSRLMDRYGIKKRDNREMFNRMKEDEIRNIKHSKYVSAKRSEEISRATGAFRIDDYQRRIIDDYEKGEY